MVCLHCISNALSFFLVLSFVSGTWLSSSVSRIKLIKDVFLYFCVLLMLCLVYLFCAAENIYTAQTLTYLNYLSLWNITTFVNLMKCFQTSLTVAFQWHGDMSTENVQKAGRRQSTIYSQNAEKLSAAKQKEIFFEVYFKTYLLLFTVPVCVNWWWHSQAHLDKACLYSQCMFANTSFIPFVICNQHP